MRSSVTINSLIKRLIIMLPVSAMVMLTSFITTKDKERRFGLENPLLISTDSIQFAPNQSEGWNLIGSYFFVENDSVTAELTLTRNLANTQAWNNVSMAGTIGGGFVPGNEQVAEFSEPNRVWRAFVKADGKCYIKLISGPYPAGNTVTLPVKIKYHK